MSDHVQPNRFIIDLNQARLGLTDISEGLPSDLLEGPPAEVLTTVAMLYGHPHPGFLSQQTQAVALLALYGAGAQVFLNTHALDTLKTRVEKYIADNDAKRPRNAEIARYVLAKAVQRHEIFDEPDPDRTYIDDFQLTHGAQDGNIDPLLPESFLHEEPGCVLRTLAFVLTHANPMPEVIHPEAQAVSYLALYAANTLIDLSAEDYARVDEVAERYEARMRTCNQTNEAFADYVRRQAREKAARAGLV